jgi:hypothetical protein
MDGLEALKDTTGIEVPAASKKTVDMEGGVIKDAVRKAQC